MDKNDFRKNLKHALILIVNNLISIKSLTNRSGCTPEVAFVLLFQMKGQNVHFQNPFVSKKQKFPKGVETRAKVISPYFHNFQYKKKLVNGNTYNWPKYSSFYN